ncbi:hypothetical protein DPV78_008517 [Talaromyces pinophilus]|nr:hypothetical protein DPV78_008517 [Talaromyces pinophilus]
MLLSPEKPKRKESERDDAPNELVSGTRQEEFNAQGTPLLFQQQANNNEANELVSGTRLEEFNAQGTPLPLQQQANNNEANELVSGTRQEEFNAQGKPLPFQQQANNDEAIKLTPRREINDEAIELLPQDSSYISIGSLCDIEYPSFIMANKLASQSTPQNNAGQLLHKSDTESNTGASDGNPEHSSPNSSPGASDYDDGVYETYERSGDWALLSIAQRYWKTNLVDGMELRDISDKLPDQGVVSICSMNQRPQNGYLLPEPSMVAVDGALFDARVIIFPEQIAEGSSGSWVIYNGKLLGYIFHRVVEVPWVYMLPIGPVFKEIENRMKNPVKLVTMSDLSEVRKGKEKESELGQENRIRTNPALDSQSGPQWEHMTPIADSDTKPNVGEDSRWHKDAVQQSRAPYTDDNKPQTALPEALGAIPAEASTSTKVPRNMSSADTSLSANRDSAGHHVIPPPPATVPGEDASLTLGDFRALLGTDGGTARGTPRPRRWCRWTPRWRQTEYHEPEDTMAMYPKILREEQRALRQLYAFDILVYTCLSLQLTISSTLVILSAISGDHHVVVAVLGAITVLITGVLSLVKGQGQPMRLLNYADSLKKVRDDIEFCECGLKARAASVTYGQVLDLWNKYTSARDSQMNNRPDVWAPQERDTRTT